MPYPLSYFSSILFPKRMFTKRRSLSIWQRLLTTLFLMSLLVLPASIQTSRLTTYPLDRLVDGVYAPLTEDVMADLSQARIVEGRFHYTGPSHKQVYTGETVEEHTGFSYQFTPDALTIRKDKTVLATISYKQMKTADFQSKKALTEAISRSWFVENRASILLLIIAVSTLLLGTNFLILLLGASGILYLTKRSRFFDFESFGECYTFSLNCLGLPTILASLAGVFGLSIPNTITLQNVLFVLLLVLVFFKTRFSDES